MPSQSGFNQHLFQTYARGTFSRHDVQQCGPGPVVLTATVGANGDAVHWYQNGSGGALLFSGNNYTTPVINSNTDYWVASYNSITGCESFRRRVHIAINTSSGTAGHTACAALRQFKPWYFLLSPVPTEIQTAGMMHPPEATSLPSQVTYTTPCAFRSGDLLGKQLQ